MHHLRKKTGIGYRGASCALIRPVLERVKHHLRKKTGIGLSKSYLCTDKMFRRAGEGEAPSEEKDWHRLSRS